MNMIEQSIILEKSNDRYNTYIQNTDCKTVGIVQEYQKILNEEINSFLNT